MERQSEAAFRAHQDSDRRELARRQHGTDFLEHYERAQPHAGHRAYVECADTKAARFDVNKDRVERSREITVDISSRERLSREQAGIMISRWRECAITGR